MKIGIITHWFPSGAGYVSKKYKYALQSQSQNEVYIYARGGKKFINDTEWDDDNVTWAPFHPCLTGIYFNHFKKWVKRNKIEAVIFNEH